MTSLSGPDEHGVFVLQMKDGKDNRFTPEALAAFNKALDTVEAHEGPTAVVITGDGKFFSNGFSMDWLMKGKPGEAVHALHSLFVRMLQLSVPSVAAVNGHAFAGGAMTALSCDHRIMNADKGFLCINELDIGLGLSPQMMLLIREKVPVSALGTVVLGATRISADAGLSLGIFHAKASESDVLTQAKLLAATHAKKGIKKDVYRSVKQEMYKDALAAMAVANAAPVKPLPIKAKL